MKKMLLLMSLLLSSGCTSHVYVVYIESADVVVDKQFDIDGEIKTKVSK